MPPVTPQKQAPKNRHANIIRSDGTPLKVVPLCCPVVSTAPTNGTTSPCPGPSQGTRPIPDTIRFYDPENPEAIAHVKSMFRELLEEMGVQSVTVTRNGQKRLPVGKAKKRAAAIADQQARMSKDDDLMWKVLCFYFTDLPMFICAIKRVIRSVWKTTFDTETLTDFTTYLPASEDHVAACDAGEGEPLQDIIVLDFGKGWENSLWNRIMLERICGLVIAFHKEQSELPDVSEGYIMGELWAMLKRSQEAWARSQLRFLPLKGDFKSADELSHCVNTYHQKRARSIASRSHHQRVRWRLLYFYCYG